MCPDTVLGSSDRRVDTPVWAPDLDEEGERNDEYERHR